MSFLENFDATTVGHVPAGWVVDSNASVVAATVHSAPNSLGTSFDNTTGHWAYRDALDDGGGDNTYEMWVQFDTTLQIVELIYRLAPGPGLASATYYAFQIQPPTDGNTNGNNGSFQRVVGGTAATIASAAVPAEGVLPLGVPIRVRVVADGTSHRGEVFIPSSGLYVTAAGLTSTTQQYCVDTVDSDPSAISGAGRTGVLWFQGTGTTILIDDVSATPLSPGPGTYAATASPTTVVAGSTTVVTVTPDAAYTGTITLTPSGAGLSAPQVLTFSASSAPQAASFTPTSAGTLTIAPTNNGSLTDPATIAVAVNPAAPGTPTGLTATPGAGTVSLSWTAPGSGGPVASYSVFRGAASGAESGTALASGLTATSHTDHTVTGGTAYFFTVKAVNATGSSAASGEATATPSAGPTPVTRDTSADFGAAFAGLAGTASFTVYDRSMAVIQAGTTAGVLEIGTGYYAATFSTGDPGPFYVLWSTGGSPPALATDFVPSPSTTLDTSEDFGAAYAGLAGTVGYTVYDRSGVEVQAATTEGVVEFSPGYYAASFGAPGPGPFYAVWSTGGASPASETDFVASPPPPAPTFRLGNSSSNSPREAATDAVSGRVDRGTANASGRLLLYSGAQPATPADAPAGTLLATVPFNNPAYSPADASGTADLAGGVPISGPVSSPGVASWLRAVDRDGNAVFDGSVGPAGSDADLAFDDATLATGEVCTIHSLSIRSPM